MKIHLKDIAEIQTGYPFRKKIVSEENGTYGIIQIRDITAKGELFAGSIIRVDMKVPAAHYIANKDDVLLQNRGTRSVSVVLPDMPNLIVSSNFFIIRPKKNLLPEYLSWYLNSPMGRDYIKLHRRGSYIPIVPKEALGEMNIVVPSIEIQRRIVELDKLACEENDLLKHIANKKSILVQAVCEKYLEKQVL